MFFQGSLQEGIAAAVQQSKYVVCFVTDGQDESRQWENEFLADESVGPLLSALAVSLRLQAGSQEEGFLAQIYPLPKKPTLVIIKNAELREYIAAGASKQDFLERLRKALQAPSSLTEPAPPTTQSTGAPSQGNSASSAEEANPTRPAPAYASAPAPSPNTSRDRDQSVFTERSARIEAQRKKQAEEMKRRRAEKAEAKAKETAETKASDPQSKHAEQLRKQQQEAREERQRILRVIEDDKAARLARQAERDAEKRAGEGGDEVGPFAPASQLLPSKGRLSEHEHCSLQVRLFDGSTIRSRFPGHDTLRGNVRQWVDATRNDGNAPYTFKVMLSPLSNRRLDVTEEDKSLLELGLTPSATLVLIPVPKSSTAYAATARRRNAVSRLFAYLLALVTGFFRMIAAFFTSLFSTNGPPAPAAARGDPQRHAERAGRDGSRVTGFGNNQRRNDQQFYNGNSTNFEPRQDEDDN